MIHSFHFCTIRPESEMATLLDKLHRRAEAAGPINNDGLFLARRNIPEHRDKDIVNHSSL